MNFDMFSNKQNDDMDPNYIYPIPYIDPMMYVNLIDGMSKMNPNDDGRLYDLYESLYE